MQDLLMKQISIDSQKDYLETDLERKVDIEENSPFQEGIISETY